MKLNLLLAICAGAAATFSNDEAGFEAWKAQHGKEYTATDEHNARFAVWQGNFATVSEHNARGAGWTMEMNEFADLTAEEFAQRLGTHSRPRPVAGRAVHAPAGDAPDAVDWRGKLVVDVKNQGSCGSCWAFSTVVGVEGQHAKATGNLVSLSEQMVVDCVKNEAVPYDNSTCCDGCQGGLMDNAFNYIVEHQAGVHNTEAKYPYKGSNGKCNFDSSDVGATITGFKDVRDMSNEKQPATAADEANLKDAVANVGPISIAVDASLGWQLYGGGVMKPGKLLGCKADPAKMDHGVAAVGYGTDNGQDYWIVRNSWGPGWGEKGYMRLEMGINACGIANSASYPTVASNATSASTTTCKATEYCCPDAKKCLTPTSTSCKDDATACGAGEVCCPLTQICVKPGADCATPCADAGTYCCPDAKACLKPTNPGVFCADASSCKSGEVCCPLTKLCVAAGDKCSPP